MSQQTHIEELEAQLEQAKRDAMPSIVVEVDHSQTERLTKNLKTGTLRLDLIDETHKPVITPRVVEVTGKRSTELPPEAELVSEDDNSRVMKLASGTVRTDITRYEAPTPINYWSC